MLKEIITEKHNPLFLLTICVIVVFFSIGIASAIILTNSEEKTNTFVIGNISCEVQDNYSVKNIGNAKCYIRAEIIVNWIDEEGNIYSESPEYSITLGEDWKQSTLDGYYYYIKEVGVGEFTSEIISEFINNTEELEGYTLYINILAEAIQSEDNNKAIEDAWKIDIENIS